MRPTTKDRCKEREVVEFPTKRHTQTIALLRADLTLSVSLIILFFDPTGHFLFFRRRYVSFSVVAGCDFANLFVTARPVFALRYMVILPFFAISTPPG
jgi:hypothetical protein